MIGHRTSKLEWSKWFTLLLQWFEIVAPFHTQISSNFLKTRETRYQLLYSPDEYDCVLTRVFLIVLPRWKRPGLILVAQWATNRTSTQLLGRIAGTDCKDAAYCYRCVVVCVCLLDITMSCAETDELIEMSFGVWTGRLRLAQGTTVPPEKRHIGGTPCNAVFRHNSLTTCLLGQHLHGDS